MFKPLSFNYIIRLLFLLFPLSTVLCVVTIVSKDLHSQDCSLAMRLKSRRIMFLLHENLLVSKRFYFIGVKS